MFETTMDRHSQIQSGQFMISHLEDSDSEPDDVDGTLEHDLHGTEIFSSERSNGMPEFDNLQSLFKCLSVAHVEKLTSPRWSHFKGSKFALKNKIRLNNLIWREYHQQYVKQRKPFAVQFQVPLCERQHNYAEGIVMEGKFWKRHSQTLCNEYRRWRLFFRNHVLRMRQTHESSSEREAIFSSEFTPRHLFQEDSQSPCELNGGFQSPAGFSITPLLDDLMEIEDNLVSLFDQPFPDQRDISLLGNADIMQPGLIQLQPHPDSFDTDFITNLLQQPSLPSSFDTPLDSPGYHCQYSGTRPPSDLVNVQPTCQQIRPGSTFSTSSSYTNQFSWSQNPHATTQKSLSSRSKRVQFEEDEFISRQSLIQSRSTIVPPHSDRSPKSFSSLKRQLVPAKHSETELPVRTEAPSMGSNRGNLLPHNSPTLLNVLLQGQPKLQNAANQSVNTTNDVFLDLNATTRCEESRNEKVIGGSTPGPSLLTADPNNVTDVSSTTAPLIVNISHEKLHQNENQLGGFIESPSNAADFQQRNVCRDEHMQPEEYFQHSNAFGSCHPYFSSSQAQHVPLASGTVQHQFASPYEPQQRSILCPALNASSRCVPTRPTFQPSEHIFPGSFNGRSSLHAVRMLRHTSRITSQHGFSEIRPRGRFNRPLITNMSSTHLPSHQSIYREMNRMSQYSIGNPVMASVSPVTTNTATVSTNTSPTLVGDCSPFPGGHQDYAVPSKVCQHQHSKEQVIGVSPSLNCSISSAPDLYNINDNVHPVSTPPLMQPNVGATDHPQYLTSHHMHRVSLPLTSAGLCGPGMSPSFAGTTMSISETVPDCETKPESSTPSEVDSVDFEDEVKPFSLISSRQRDLSDGVDAVEDLTEEESSSALLVFGDETDEQNSITLAESSGSSATPAMMSSVNTEQRRRQSMQSSLNELHELVAIHSSAQQRGEHLPVLGRSDLSKVASMDNNHKTSKAAILRGAANLIQSQRSNGTKLATEIIQLQAEINSLQGSIYACCERLPVSEACPKSQANAQDSESAAWYREFVSTSSQENWKFYIFSLIINNLFDSFYEKIATSSREALRLSTDSWLKQHCTLPQLRNLVVQAMCQLGTSTSVLHQPQLLPEEARRAAANLASNLFCPEGGGRCLKRF